MALSALDFSSGVGTSKGYAFGVSSESSVSALRSLADSIERKEVLIQSVRVTGLAATEDFTLTGIRLVLAEKITVP
jgi:hypothetical protein